MSRKWGRPYVATEQQEQAYGERLMVACGFTLWRLSQARATRQTPGWPDVFFTAPGHCVAWEAKREGGKQRPAQREFQAAWGAAIPATYFEYVLGPASALEAWLVAHGYATRAPGGHLVVTRKIA